MMINSQDDIYATFAWQDTCYKIDGLSAVPILYINTGSKGISKSIKNGTYDEKTEYLNSSASNNKYLFFKLCMYENDNFMIACTKGFSPPTFYVYMRLNGNDYFVNNMQNDFITGKPNVYLNLLSMEQDYCFNLIVPEEDPSNELKQYMELLNLGADDNPVILFFKLKNI